MGDAWLIIAVFVFAFILWVSTGGPDRPISFAGPYITPITDVGDVQEGYGEDFDIGPGEDDPGLWSVRSLFGRFEGSLDDEEDIGVASPLRGSVEIVSGAGGPSGSEVAREYVTLRAETETDITGWQLVSGKSGAIATIPAATIAPPRGPLTSVVLRPGDEAVVTTGSSPIGVSFRENMCTGYLDQGSFVPALNSRSCPSPTEELGDFYTGSASSYDECRAIVSGYGRCVRVTSAPREASSECEQFIETRLNYEGCVAGHFNDPDYRGDTWRLYLNHSRELWRSDNDSIKLLDREGRAVDIYSY